ncbi:MAG TPA: ABC transporter permease [Bacteroidales bacterium]|nr:ABC transporter permease [Bacteroidales bacterium]
MFKNYLIIAWRNITKDKFYTLLNMLGLAIGLTASVFIFLYIMDELTYDRSHLNHKRIYRLESHFVINGKDDLFAATQIPLGPTLKDEYPEIEEYVRFAQTGTMFLKYGDKEFQEDSIVYADSTIFSVFTHPLMQGDPKTVLNRPYTMVMTEKLAKKYFGSEDPVGKTLKSVEGNLYEVTGVIKDLPGNLHMKFEGLLSVATVRQEIGVERFNDRSAGSFWNIGIYNYIMLKEGASIDPILEKFPDFYTKYMKSLGDQINGSFTLMAKPLARVHHHSSDLGYDQPGGNIRYVYVFSLVAILILVIACINYMNLATARSARRSKETGMRKIAGAQRRMLIRQFLIESLVIAMASTVIAILLSRLLLPWFNMIANKTLDFSMLFTPVLLCCIAGLAIVVGLISGSYPALYLSSFNPVNVIKGQADNKGGNGLLRKILVVFQFTVSVAMITGTFIISSQLNFLQNTDPGFAKEDMLVMEMRDTTFKKSLEPFKQELLKNPDIKGVAFSNGNPGYDLGIQVMRIEGDSGNMVDRAVNNFFADYDYIDLMGIKVVEGRYYSRDMKSDPLKAFVINETAARKFGWIDSASAAAGNYASAIGKRFHFGINLDGTAARDGYIVGVVKDFHYASMRNPIEPLVILLNDQDRFNFFANIRINSRNRQKTMEYINQVRQDFKDIYPFKYKFLDENMKEYYLGEKRIGMLSRTFALLTVIIAALGLLGLSSFLTQTRTREIGIRKISGASANNIVLMFAREFSLWIFLANIIAAPVALYTLNKWLQAFPYKTDIHIWIFVAGLFISVFVALLTVSLRVFQAASINPSDAMRYN